MGQKKLSSLQAYFFLLFLQVMKKTSTQNNKTKKITIIIRNEYKKKYFNIGREYVLLQNAQIYKIWNNKLLILKCKDQQILMLHCWIFLDFKNLKPKNATIKKFDLKDR